MRRALKDVGRVFADLPQIFTNRAGKENGEHDAEEIVLRVCNRNRRVVILSGAAVTPALSREAQKPMNATTYQLQSANASYAFAPQQVYAGPRSGQCWIATDSSRPYGYTGSCANPLAQDPSLDPTYNPEW